MYYKQMIMSFDLEGAGLAGSNQPKGKSSAYAGQLASDYSLCSKIETEGRPVALRLSQRAEPEKTPTHMDAPSPRGLKHDLQS